MISYAERERKAAARRREAAHRAELIQAVAKLLVDKLDADDLQAPSGPIGSTRSAARAAITTAISCGCA
jgi:hypothetical protein